MMKLEDFEAGQLYELTANILNPLRLADRRRTVRNWLDHHKIYMGEVFICVPSYEYNGRLSLISARSFGSVELGLFEGKNTKRAALVRLMCTFLEPVKMDLANTLLGAVRAHSMNERDILMSLVASGALSEAALRAELEKRAAASMLRWREAAEKHRRELGTP